MSRKEYFILDQSVDPNKDEIIEFLQLDDGKDYQTPSPDKMMPLAEYEKLTPNDVSKLFRDNYSSNYSLFQQFREQQLAELNRTKKDLKDFYTTSWDYSQYGKGMFSPMEIARLTLQKKIRVARIREVLEPQFAEVLVPHNKTQHKYWVARAYWWDDYGKRSRSVTKSIRRSDLKVIDRLRNIYEDMDFEVSTDKRLKNNTIADLVIKKKNEEYVVEVKKIKFEDLARFILSMGMWEDYKKIYLSEKKG
jgi:hypothetical protein